MGVKYVIPFGFASKLDFVSNAHAVSAAETRMKTENLQKQIDELRARQ